MYTFLFCSTRCFLVLHYTCYIHFTVLLSRDGTIRQNSTNRHTGCEVTSENTRTDCWWKQQECEWAVAGNSIVMTGGQMRNGRSDTRGEVTTACAQKWWIRTGGRGEKRRAQSRGMQPNHYNRIQLMTNAIAGVRKGSENTVFKV